MSLTWLLAAASRAPVLFSDDPQLSARRRALRGHVGIQRPQGPRRDGRRGAPPACVVAPAHPVARRDWGSSSSRSPVLPRLRSAAGSCSSRDAGAGGETLAARIRDTARRSGCSTSRSRSRSSDPARHRASGIDDGWGRTSRSRTPDHAVARRIRTRAIDSIELFAPRRSGSRRLHDPRGFNFALIYRRSCGAIPALAATGGATVRRSAPLGSLIVVFGDRARGSARGRRRGAPASSGRLVDDDDRVSVTDYATWPTLA